jgi:hypothetical protein
MHLHSHPVHIAQSYCHILLVLLLCALGFHYRSRSFEAPRFTVPASLKLGLAGALQLGVLATALTGGPWVPAEILALALPAGLSW